jgi:integrase-like protein
VRQELLAEKSITLSLRTIEREVAPLRRQLEAEARATIRFETPPGKQLQIDFGERRMLIGGDSVKVYLFAATPGYSRRIYVRAFRNERQESWFAGLEGAFRHFGGVTDEVLFDNDRGLVVRHDRATREVEFNARLHAFATGIFGRGPAPLIGHGQKAKTSAASATSRRTRSPAALSRAGRLWKGTLWPGPATSPISGCTALRVRSQSCSVAREGTTRRAQVPPSCGLPGQATPAPRLGRQNLNRGSSSLCRKGSSYVG